MRVLRYIPVLYLLRHRQDAVVINISDSTGKRLVLHLCSAPPCGGPIVHGLSEIRVCARTHARSAEKP